MKITFGSITREGSCVRRDLNVLHSVLTKLCCYDHHGYDFCASLDDYRNELLNENLDIKDVLGDFRDMLRLSLNSDK